MAMKKWKCPKCGFILRALGKTVHHRCPVTKRDEWLKEEAE